jgi:Holliday junction resolvasome RuvABC endonuclease subunit
MKILALDPATKTGYEHTNGFGGVWDCSVKKDESSGMRFLRLYAHLTDVYENHGIDLVLFESPGNKKFIRSVVIQAKIQGTIELWCTHHNVQYEPVSPMTIKVFATGNNKATKEEMISAAKTHIGRRKVRGDDHADAILILQWGLVKYSGNPGEVIAEIVHEASEGLPEKTARRQTRGPKES